MTEATNGSSRDNGACERCGRQGTRTVTYEGIELCDSCLGAQQARNARQVAASFNVTKAGYKATLEEALDAAHKRAICTGLAPETQAVVYSRQANGFVVLSRDIAEAMLAVQAKALEGTPLEHEPELEIVLSAIV